MNNPERREASWSENNQHPELFWSYLYCSLDCRWIENRHQLWFENIILRYSVKIIYNKASAVRPLAWPWPRKSHARVCKAFWIIFFFTVIYSRLYSAWYCLMTLYDLFSWHLCVFTRSADNPGLSVFKILTIINDSKVQYAKVWLANSCSTSLDKMDKSS